MRFKNFSPKPLLCRDHIAVFGHGVHLVGHDLTNGLATLAAIEAVTMMSLHALRIARASADRRTDSTFVKASANANDHDSQFAELRMIVNSFREPACARSVFVQKPVHFLIRPAKMMANLMDHDVRDQLTQADIAPFGPLVEDRPAIQEDPGRLR